MRPVGKTQVATRRSVNVAMPFISGEKQISTPTLRPRPGSTMITSTAVPLEEAEQIARESVDCPEVIEPIRFSKSGRIGSGSCFWLPGCR
jgi:hypothetical protein